MAKGRSPGALLLREMLGARSRAGMVGRQPSLAISSMQVRKGGQPWDADVGNRGRQSAHSRRQFRSALLDSRYLWTFKRGLPGNGNTDLPLRTILWTRQLNSGESSTQVTDATLEVDEVPRERIQARKAGPQWEPEGMPTTRWRRQNRSSNQEATGITVAESLQGGRQTLQRSAARPSCAWQWSQHQGRQASVGAVPAEGRKGVGPDHVGGSERGQKGCPRAGHHRKATCFHEKRGLTSLPLAEQ